MTWLIFHLLDPSLTFRAASVKMTALPSIVPVEKVVLNVGTINTVDFYQSSICWSPR